MSLSDSDDLVLGPCCICGRSKEVRNIIMLDKRSPYGHGWSCVVCGLPPEGAIIIVCNACFEQYDKAVYQHAKWFCVPDTQGNYVTGRAPISELDTAPVHEHDIAKHPEKYEGL